MESELVKALQEKAVKDKLTASVNPATGEIIGYTKEDSVEDVINAVKLARIAQQGWGKKTFEERAEYIFRIRDYIVKNSDMIAEVISRDNGKTRMDALSTEVFPITMAITYYAKNAKKLLKRKHLKAGNILTLNKRSYIDHVPMGVVGIISPWNYPFAIPFHEIVMALITGNAVILKVATQTLEVGKVIKQCIDAGKLPENLFSFFNIPGHLAGDAFIDSGIDKLFFTGSVPVGKKLMAKAAERLMPVSLELGGNDAMIVCKDADISRAVSGAIWAGYSNAGQSCAAVERIYVEKEIYENFISKLKEGLKTLRVGIDNDFNVDMGSMTTESQLRTVKLHIKDALEKGATAFVANPIDEAQKGLFHPAVILEGVNDSMLVMQQETFGPVVGVEKIESIDEAIQKANNSTLGLTASVWTKDKEKAQRIASRLEAGAIMINDHLMSHGLAETPWGGFKESGLGRTHGYIGLEEMTQPRVVVDDIMPGVKKNIWWHPHNKNVYDGLKGAISFLYSKDLSEKVSGLIKLSKVFMRTFKN
jgi:succinate-semialdehyde dehydrogenase/glutarate-semialdehyde dehydrogenase